MTEVKSGVMEAFSFRKGVVKISGQWLRFGPELEGLLKGLKVGDRVSYTVEARTLKTIEKQQPVAVPSAISKQTAIPPTTQRPAVATFSVPTPDNRNRSIERQTALKAAVELAQLLGYKSTGQCLDVAASFAAWIETGPTMSQSSSF